MRNDFGSGYPISKSFQVSALNIASLLHQRVELVIGLDCGVVEFFILRKCVYLGPIAGRKDRHFND
jgi:hypothetical protein